jgi:hypothetical protein
MLRPAASGDTPPSCGRCPAADRWAANLATGLAGEAPEVATISELETVAAPSADGAGP